MLRLVNTLAAAAAFLALAVAVWRDYGLLAGVRRAALAYLAVFVVSALLALLLRAGVLAEEGRRKSAADGGGAAEPARAPAPGRERDRPPAR